MKCPKCDSEHIEIYHSTTINDSVEIEIECDDCAEITAFYRIKDNLWIMTED